MTRGEESNTGEEPPSWNIAYVRTPAWIPVVVTLVALILPLALYAWLQDLLQTLGSNDAASAPDGAFSWESAFEQVVAGLGLLVFWLAALLYFFLSPRHVWITPDQIRWKTIGRQGSVYDLSDIESFNVVYTPPFKALWFTWERPVVHLKLKGRRLRLSVGTTWKGSREFFRLLRDQRPDLFVGKDLPDVLDEG